MANNIAVTPPSLLGIDRRIVYAHRKYHSGLMWIGVDRGLAGMKFSGSVNRKGNHKTTIKKGRRITANPRRSLTI